MSVERETKFEAPTTPSKISWLRPQPSKNAWASAPHPWSKLYTNPLQKNSQIN